MKSLLLIGLSLAMGGCLCSAAEPYRVAVVAREETEASATVRSAVGKISGIEVVSPEEARRVTGRQAPEDNAAGHRAFSRLLSIDFLLILDRDQNAFTRYDTGTGEEMFRIREDSAVILANSAVMLIEEERDVAVENAKRTPSPVDATGLKEKK